MASKSKKTRKSAIALPSGGTPAALPEVLSPQLATLVSSPPTTGEWEYEIKLDGYRLLARIEGDDVRLLTRNANDWTAKLLPLAEAVRKLNLESAWIDGEIVIAAGNRSSFQALQNAFDTRRVHDVQYYIFDLPYFAGLDLRHLPLRERRGFLQSIMDGKGSERVKFSETFGTDAKRLLDAACQMNLEGIIGKRVDSPYSSRRSSTWIKLRCSKRQEFVVVGFSDPQGQRTGFGSLILAVNDPDGLHYAGSVGTGFDERTLRSLSKRLKELKQPKAPLVEVPSGLNGHWVQPKLVAEVSFSEWTDEGRIRHPVFHGLRTDKPPSEITRETPLRQDSSINAPVSNRWRRKRVR